MAPAAKSSPDLVRVIGSQNLADLVAAHAELFGVGIAILSPAGLRLAAAGAGVDAPELGHHHIHPLYHRGARLADLVIGPCLRRTGRAAVGTVPLPPSSALAAAIPELGQDDLERIASHIERVLLALVRVAGASALPGLGGGPGGMAGVTPPAMPAPEEVGRVKSNFLATVSHELRTPLTSVIGYAEMLLEGMAGPITEEQREYLSTILGKADHLLRLITNMLELARMDAGPPSVQRAPVSVAELIERAATSLSSEVDRRAITLALPVAPMPRVLADGRKIRQVLVHLLANAVKFSPRGGDVVVEAQVGPLSPTDRDSPLGSLRPDDLARRYGVRISVRDTGIGISPVAQARIFEPFFQVDQSSTREYGGTGLGLSLAKSYVEAHGGSIWVTSTPGQGSTFTLSLPAVPEDLVAHVQRGVRVGPPA